jgi:hypothetical protein
LFVYFHVFVCLYGCFFVACLYGLSSCFHLIVQSLKQAPLNGCGEQQLPQLPDALHAAPLSESGAHMLLELIPEPPAQPVIIGLNIEVLNHLTQMPEDITEACRFIVSPGLKEHELSVDATHVVDDLSRALLHLDAHAPQHHTDRDDADQNAEHEQLTHHVAHDAEPDRDAHAHDADADDGHTLKAHHCSELTNTMS